MRLLNISRKLPSLANALETSFSGSGEPSLSLLSLFELIFVSLSFYSVLSEAKKLEIFEILH